MNWDLTDVPAIAPTDLAAAMQALIATTRGGEATESIYHPRRVPLKTIARLQLLTAAGLLVFWLLFFTVGLAPADPPFGYFVFEHTFTVPDIILALAFIRAGTWLLSEDGVRRSRGRALSLVCSGALLFLGMLDISFDVRNSFFSLLSLATIVEMAVDAWCIGFGVLCALSVASQPDPIASGPNLTSPLVRAFLCGPAPLAKGGRTEAPLPTAPEPNTACHFSPRDHCKCRPLH